MVRQYGLSWVAWRGAYEVALRSGLLRRCFPPVADPLAELAWALRLSVPAAVDHLATSPMGGFFLPADVRAYGSLVGDPSAAVAEADAICAGRVRFFSDELRAVGNPPDWLRSPDTGTRWPVDRHWSQIEDLGDRGDIKMVYEMSRFGHVFPLVRAYAVTGDDRYADAFWVHFESWCAANPPEMGPNWHDGQEMALRVLAWLFALHAFGRCSATTSARRAHLIAQVWFHCRHIERVHWVAARCMRNNHAISEAVALYTVGAVLPVLPEAGRWRRIGMRWTAHELAWQVYDDGSYVQQSTNYARVVAQLLTWTVAVARANGERAPDTVLDRADRLLVFLAALQDPMSGRLPNYGSNDGALPLLLSGCEYDDYRPAVAALSRAVGRGRMHSVGPWDAEASWYFGPDGTSAPPGRARPPHSFPVGGYYVLDGQSTRGVTRCARYRHRPGQADMLHLDIWCNGQNVCMDAGSYSYNAPGWSVHFRGTGCHNTVTVNGRDQMRRGARFLWLDWTQARVLRDERAGASALFVGEHDAYRPVKHRRTLLLDAGVWWVLDEMEGATSQDACRLHWLMPDGELRHDGTAAVLTAEGLPTRLMVLCSVASEVTWVRGQEAPPRGWHSRRYGRRDPAWSCAVEASGRDVRFLTVISAEVVGGGRDEGKGERGKGKGETAEYPWPGTVVSIRPSEGPTQPPVVESRKGKGESHAQRPTPNDQRPTPNAQRPTPTTEHRTPNTMSEAEAFMRGRIAVLFGRGGADG